MTDKDFIPEKELTKVTMNLTKGAIEDAEAITVLSGMTSTKTSSVIRALKVYRLLLEEQKEGKKIVLQGKKKDETLRLL